MNLKMRGQMQVKMFQHPLEQNASKSLLPDHFIKDILIPLGSLLIGAIPLLAVKEVPLPTWAIFIVISYLVIVTTIVSLNPLIKLISFLREKADKRRFAKTYYPRLQDCYRDFDRLIDDQKTDTIHYLLQEIISGRRGAIRSEQFPYDLEHVATLRSWFSSVEEQVDTYKPKNFTYLASALSHLISQHHRYCLKALQLLESLIAQGTIAEQQLRLLKQDWNLRRETYMQFIRKWENLTKNINESMNERVCVDWYEPLKTLE